MTARETRTRGASGIAFSLAFAAVAAIAVLLYMAPAGEPDRFGIDAAAAAPFAEALLPSTDVPSLPSSTFRAWLRALTVLAWLAWGAGLVLGWRRPGGSWRVPIAAVSLTALLAAVFIPPVLSNDVYGYTAFARVSWQHGLNPYDDPRGSLEAAGDPAAGLIIWDVPVPYGPLWSLMATGLGAAANAVNAGLFAEAVAHKLLAGLALVLAAIAGALVADRREPGRGALVLTAIGLNPLFVLEGPGSGHNDFLMLGLLMAAAALDARNRPSAGALAVGLAVAIKPTAMLALPFLLYSRWTAHAARRASLVATSLFVLLPTVILSFAYGGPAILAGAVGARVSHGNTPTKVVLGVVLLIGALAWGAAVARRQREIRDAAWLTAWIPGSLVLALLVSPIPFPWYLAWGAMPALAGGDERHRLLILVTSILGLWSYWIR